MKITIVAGARPNFMKIAPITRAIEAARALGKSISYRLVYTGRKDDTSLDASLFSDLDMKAPDVYLGVESSNPTSLTAGIMVAFEQELTENPAHVVLVVDDLTATMSCAIVAKKQGIKVAHLVAGTRSFDMKMPKEVNRMITDGLSDYLFAGFTQAAVLAAADRTVSVRNPSFDTLDGILSDFDAQGLHDAAAIEGANAFATLTK